MNKLFQLIFFASFFTFFISCEESTTGVQSNETNPIKIFVKASGSYIDKDGFTLSVDDSRNEAITIADPNASGAAKGKLELMLNAGMHTLELKDIAANCAVKGDNPIEIDNQSDSNSEVQFEVFCKEILVNKVVLISNQDGPLDIYVADPSENGRGFSNFKRLTQDDYSEQHPTISPDGTQIAFTKNGNIWTIDADGRNEQQITKSGYDFKPVWLPEQHKLAFTSTRDGRA